MVAEVKPDQQAFLPDGKYTLDLSGPLKVYAHVKDSVQVYSDTERTHVSFGKTSSVIVGARSRHTRPARTITTTSDPVDVMQTVSMFGSALKTTTAERSYPTLRGHPPAVKLGSELAIPSELKQPKTGIEIEVPLTLEHVFVVAPLAYYLGAKIVPGSVPQLTTETGYNRTLIGERGFESTVRRILKHVFFLDCIVRTEGITPLPLREQNAVESVLDFEIEPVYKQSLPKQLETYFSVPFSAIKPYFSEWRLETKLKPKKEFVEFLPFISNSLSTINIQSESEDIQSPNGDQAQAISEFTRSNLIRSTDPVRSNDTSSNPIVESTPPTIQQVWNSQNTSEIVSTTPLSAFENSIGRNPRSDPIEIQVVCNDLDMHKELKSVNNIYGSREELPFDVTVHHDVTINELEQLLTTESDFLHYIGHIDGNGFQCSDGKLNASEIEKVSVKAFLLNACQSHNQGLHLVEAGSIGGIVTLGDVVNSGAVRVGSTIAQLLNQGFPLYGALSIAKNESIIGKQYLIVGDGMTTIAQSETEVPNSCVVKNIGDKISAEIYIYDSVQAKVGSLFTPHLGPIDSYHLVPGKTQEVQVGRDQFRDFLAQGKFPVLFGESVCWSDEIHIDTQ
ncbi:hypothetical protein [Natronococcus pandeyae]|nr:hypothetical protein [Natronococcus pandeyae]